MDLPVMRQHFTHPRLWLWCQVGVIAKYCQRMMATTAQPTHTGQFHKE